MGNPPRVRGRVAGSARRLVHRLDPLLAREGERAAQRLEPVRPYSIRLDAPPSSDPRPRWGHGRAQHARIGAVLAAHHDRYAAELDAFAAYADDFARIPARPTEPTEPCWLNQWLPGLDTISLYGFVRERRPSRYVEVGSGQSTLVVSRAVADGDLSTTITSIDPQPRADIDAACDRVLRQPLESVDLGVFTELTDGDIVFYDGSHRVFTSSDTVVFYLDVLPELRDGVIVGVHDIHWPDDYLPEWQEYWFSEQYLLGAYLLADPSWMELILASAYAASMPDLRARYESLWSRPDLALVDRRGFGFWFRIRRR